MDVGQADYEYSPAYDDNSVVLKTKIGGDERGDCALREREY